MSTRAIVATDARLAQHGQQQGRIPREMRLHSH
jgi:NTE family protein